MDVFSTLSSGGYSLAGTTVINTVDMHTGGEPTRIIVKGYPSLEGNTLLEKRTYAREKLDGLRQRLMREPRGHKEMYGAILVPQTEKTRSGDADIGILFCHNEGYSTMCGHATIALGRFLVDTQDEAIFPRRQQIVCDPVKRECMVRLHAPCGVVDVTVPTLQDGGRVQSDPEREVHFISVRSFASATGVVIEVPEELLWPELRDTGRRAVEVDLAYGGAFYVVVEEQQLGFGRVREGEVDLKRLDAATAAVKQLVGAKKELFQGHGLEHDLEYLYGVIVVEKEEGEVGLGGLEGRLGVCFFADQQVDRSPTGSGVSARVALARAKGLLGERERVRFDSPLSARVGCEAGAFVGSGVGAERPQPDPALLNTDPPTADNIADDAAKVNIVSPDFKQDPATETSTQDVPSGAPIPSGGRRRRYIDEVEREGFYVGNLAKQYLLHPGVAGGLIGLINLGLVSGAAYKFYNDPHLRRDTRAIVSAVAGALTLLSAEGYAAEKYRETPRGQREAEKVKREGAAIYRTAREHVLRPGVLGGLLGVLNAGVLGAVGYLSYTNWDRPTWDRRIVSAVSVGLLTLWGSEGYIAERYRSTHH
ncbi:hypothetical protein GSI_01726 [Ganoderma sinense ZZ0214-1]|uniref:trans-L-3-hydroxyproline dehydratase n=1 Tax=Ganoderma sinense ZZ0214-1 TaxID=1077348 RepID=A0A2G8SQM1_9APHY|nr:hypothetical protein GSI_01726 [Ganoderma sinense ZZ0214-1]